MSRPPSRSEADARFAFGDNWRRFLEHVNDDRIGAAVASLSGMIGAPSLAGRTFLDVGSGSGLFSLAAVRLGADAVHSFDFDPESVACAEDLRRRFAPDAAWRIERGSVLDDAYLAGLGRWDVVYSWGVLHHTGDMWRAVDRASHLVSPGGQLFIAIYNDQGWRSRLWTLEKRLYVNAPALRPLLVAGGVAAFAASAGIVDLVRGRAPWRRYRETGVRGMAVIPDLIDWLGGYPFEVASPQAVVTFVEARGLEPERTVTCGGKMGCNEFVFRSRSGDRTPVPGGAS